MVISTVYFLAVDVSQKTLELFGRLLHFKLPAQIPNDPRAIAELLKALRRCRCLGGAALPRLHVICEASGGYERALAEALWALNIKVSIVNPKQVRDYIRACGVRAKTDRIDARMLCGFGVERRPDPTPAPSAAMADLRLAVNRRGQLLKSLREHLCQLKQLMLLNDRELIAEAQELIALLRGQIAKLEKRMAKIIKECPELAAKSALLQQVKGVGFLTAAGLLALVPELGRVNRNQAAALLGVAPINADSGNFRGRRFVQGGRQHARATLYMAALTAARSNAYFKNFYNRLIAKGKAPKLALTAVMNKLIKLLNSILKNPNFILQPQ